MRACLIAEIFDKATTLSPQGRVGVSKGEVNNLVAVDTQKIFEVSLNAHLLWSSPLQVVVVAGLLLGLTGPSTLLGITTLVAVLPLSKMIIKEFMRLRQLRMIATDERVQVVSEVLSGIRVTKLNGWEPLWIQRLHDVRRAEVKLTASELWVFGWSMMASNGVIPPCRLELTSYFLCVSYFTGYGHEPRFGPHGDDKLADAF
jgi:ABC-type multidrug transport system fused ATPase/permease subunit